MLAPSYFWATTASEVGVSSPAHSASVFLGKPQVQETHGMNLSADQSEEDGCLLECFMKEDLFRNEIACWANFRTQEYRCPSFYRYFKNKRRKKTFLRIQKNTYILLIEQNEGKVALIIHQHLRFFLCVFLGINYVSFVLTLLLWFFFLLQQ